MKLLSRQEELLLLSVWHLKDNAYGVTIRDRLMEVTGENYVFGAIFIMLKQLTKKGLVESHLSEPTSERGGRSKRMYTLTQDGRDSLLKIKQIDQIAWEGIEGLSME